MTTLEFVAATILKATGEVFAGTVGDAEYEKVRGIGNFYIPQWEDEPDVDWESLYTPEFEIGTVTATSTYDLDDDVRKVSDKKGDVVRIDHTDGVSYTDYEIVPANELKRYYSGDKSGSLGNYCAQIGRQLVFNHTFVATDAQFGGTIKVPIYTYAELLVSSGDEVPVDKPNWLVLVSSAEYVRNDITLQNQYGNLIAEANQSMERMKSDNNNAQVNTIYRVPVGGGATW